MNDETQTWKQQKKTSGTAERVIQQVIEQAEPAFAPVQGGGISPRQWTTHAMLRCGQRGLSAADVEYVAARGTFYCGNDADYIYLRNADIPTAERRTMSRLAGTAIVLSKCGRVITVWRNQRNGLQKIRAKVARIHH